jgi:hypothetical protein
MNMPIDANRQVHFTTTLFALIRESLGIKMRAGKLIIKYLTKHKKNLL